jgi:lactate permease
MSLPDLTVLNALLAAAPLLVVLYLMIGRNWGGSKAGPAGWFVAAVLAVVAFGGNAALLLVAFGRSLLLALYVLYIIWMALLLYHVVNEAGAIDVIGQELPGLAPDRAGQAMLLAWVFGSFLQGASGFGVPAAVVAPLLVGLAFPPNVAVAVALLGHGWAVTFGSLGSSFLALMATTGLPGEALAGDAAMLLLVACLGCGLGVLLTAGGRQALRQRWPFLLALTAVMGGVQWALAVAGLWTMAALGGGLAGLFVTIIYFRVASSRQGQASTTQNGRLLRAFLPYAILMVVVVVGQLLLSGPLDSVQLSFDFPAVTTSFGWRTPAGPGRSISVFGHAGALLLYASILAFLWFRWQRTFTPRKPYRAATIVRKTVRGSVKSTISIVTLVAMALTMQHAGMTQLLAEGLSGNTGRFFPLISPLIGALGAFVTGSNTNSNVVFGQLQQQTALALGVSVSLILAAQTAGGAIGSIFAPAKVVVGVSTVAGADDGRVLRLATAYGMGIILLTGLLVWLLT